MEVKENLYRGVNLELYPLQTDFEVPRIKKMYKAFLKAIVDHGMGHVLPRLDLELKREKYVPLSPLLSECSSIGMRNSMEDTSFKTLKHGEKIYIGVFDGHNDASIISKSAAEEFKNNFEEELELHQGDVKRTFSAMIQTIHQNVTKNMQTREKKGSTVLFSYLNLKTNLLFTCTLGDSWSKLYRRRGDTIFSISLSKNKNIANEKVRDRLMQLYKEDNTPESLHFADSIPSHVGNPKRFKLIGGLNCLHAVGDSWYGNKVSQQSNQTVIQVVEGDLLVDACDGVWDYMGNEQDLVDNVIGPNWDQKDLAQRIVNYIFERMKRKSKEMRRPIGDNISVITAWMRPSGEDSYYEDTESFHCSDSEDDTQEETFWSGRVEDGKTIEELVNSMEEEEKEN